MTPPASRIRSLLAGGGSIAIAMGVMNVATYAFTMIAARMLGPKSYGAFAGLMATLLVVAVLQLGLQATAARRIAAEPAHVAQIEKTILGVTYRAAAALGVLLLVLAPLLNQILRLDSLATAALLSVVSIPFTIMGGQAGILQGERRWAALSVLYILSGVPRLIIGTALIVWRPTEFAALVGIGIGACFPVIAGWWFLRRPRDPGVHSEDHGFRRVMAETFHNSQVLLAFFALSNVDIVLARNVLDEHDAGLYAGGLILTKAVLFLPQFIVVIAFPSMATQSGRRRALTGSLSLIAAARRRRDRSARPSYPTSRWSSWAATATTRSPTTCGSSRSSARSSAMLQLLVYSVLARQGQRSVYLVWIALAVIIGVGLTTSTLRGLLTVVITTDAVLLAALLCISLVVIRRAHADQPGVSAGSVSRFVPAAPEADRDVQRDRQVGGAAHLLADQRLERLVLARGHVEHELVVDLEQHPRPQPGRRQLALHVEHRDLDQVGGRALDRRVERHPLGHLAALPVVAGQVGQVAAAAHDRLGEAGTPCLVDDDRRGSRGCRRRSRSTRPSGRGPRSGRCRAADRARRPTARRRGRSSSP